MGMHVLKPTMTRGEISPLAYARRDIELYQAAAERLENFLVLREGGVRRRSGTKYRGAARNNLENIRLHKFTYNQAYVLEFGGEYVRFWADGGQVTSGGLPYEIPSPYLEADLPDLQFVQSGDVIYVAFRSMTQPPQKLIRYGHTSWAFVDVEFRDGPYLPINDTVTTVTPSIAPATGGTSTLTFSIATYINGGNGFLPTDVGRLIRCQFDGEWSWGVITTRNSGTEIVVTWTDGRGGTTASRSWRLGAFSDTTGYPGSVAIFDGRLVWGGTPTNPRYLGYSYSNLPEVYIPSDPDGTVNDANGGAFDILSGDEILWLQDAPRLQIGMPRAVQSLGASDLDQAFGPRNVRVKNEINEGVSSVRPEVVGSSTVHVGRFEKTLNDLFFDYSVNSLIRPEISTVAEHLFDATVKELVFQQLPHRRLWSILNDGTAVCTTIDRYEKVLGYSRHDFGGEILSAQSIPGETHDELWMVVRRTINGVQKQYLETLEADFLRGSLEDAFFVDCGGTYDGAATNTVSGITWLAGETVSILADGRVLPDQEVSAGGVLTLPYDRTAEKITFGLPYTSTGKLLPIPANAPNGALLGRRTKVVSVDIDVYETKGLRVVSDRDVETELKERPASAPPEGDFFDGWYRVLGEGSWTGKGQISFVADKPVPATIRGFNLHVNSED